LQIGDANKYTITTQNTFNTNLKSSECTADNRIRNSWQCSFGQVYSITSKVELALQLIDSCISNKVICGSFEEQSCPNKSYVSLSEINPRNDTIRNPFKFVTNAMSCVEVLISN